MQDQLEAQRAEVMKAQQNIDNISVTLSQAIVLPQSSWDAILQNLPQQKSLLLLAKFQILLEGDQNASELLLNTSFKEALVAQIGTLLSLRILHPVQVTEELVVFESEHRASVMEALGRLKPKILRFEVLRSDSQEKVHVMLNVCSILHPELALSPPFSPSVSNAEVWKSWCEVLGLKPGLVPDIDHFDQVPFSSLPKILYFKEVDLLVRWPVGKSSVESSLKSQVKRARFCPPYGW